MANIKERHPNKDVMTITLTEYQGWQANSILIQEWWKAKELIEQGVVRLVDHEKDRDLIEAKRIKEEKIFEKLN